MSALKKTRIQYISKGLAKLITDLSPPIKLAQSFVFVYSGQRPNVALFIESGEFMEGDQNFCVLEKDHGVLLLFEEFNKGQTFMHDLQILKDSKVSTIDLLAAREILRFKKSKGVKS